MSYWGEIEIIQNWQDKVNAVSNVTANFYACSSSYAGWSNYTTYPVVKLHNTQETQTLKSFDFRKSLKILIGSITTNVQHNPNGTMSVDASFTWDSDHSLVGTLTGSATKELTTIPRASKVFATNADIGSTSTITINKADNSFTHTLEYSFEGLTGTIATKTSQESVGWEVPKSFFQKIPESQNGTVTITCKTYSGDTLVGTSSTTATVTVPTSGPNSSMPVVESATAVDTNSKTIALTGGSSRLVNYFSKVKISVVGKCLNYGTFSVLKSNNQSMEIKNKTSSNGTTTVNGEITHNSNDKNAFTVFIGDKRGLWAQRILNEANGDFIIVPYIPLTMKANVERKSQTSNSIKMNFTGNFYNGYFDASKNNFNNLKIKWRYKLTDSGTWIANGSDNDGWHNLTLNTDFKYDEGKNTYQSNGDIVISDLFDYQEKYTIEISYEDELDAYTVQKPLPAGIPNHDYGVDAEGKNYFNVNGDMYIKGMTQVEAPINFGATREITVNGSYVRLFTFTMTQNWKNTSVWFTLCDTQGERENVLCNLYARHEGSDVDISVTNFTVIKAKNSTDFDTNRLVAIVTSKTTIEVYFKMGVNDSPAISILSMTRFRQSDTFGKIILDCKTVVSTLPEGKKYFSNNEKITTDVKLITGEEYATNEYIDGERVYEKILEKTMDTAGAEVVSFEHGITNAKRIWIDVSNSYLFTSSSNNRCLPLIETFYTSYSNRSTREQTSVFVESDKVYFIADGGWGAHWSIVFRLKYTKA